MYNAHKAIYCNFVKHNANMGNKIIMNINILNIVFANEN